MTAENERGTETKHSDREQSMGLIGAMTLVVALVMFYDQIAEMLTILAEWLGLAIMVAIIMAGLAGLLWIGSMAWMWVEQALKIRAERFDTFQGGMVKYKDSRVVTNGDQTYLFDWEKSEVEALHLDPRWRHNSVYTDPKPEEAKTWEVFTLRKQPAPQLPAPQSPLLEQGKPQLMRLIADKDRILTLGGSGSGKTSLMQHYVTSKPGDIVVIDPDDDSRTWPGNARVIGGGENWQAIEAELSGFVAEKKRRYQERSTGVTNWTPLYMVMEEWYKTLQYVEGGRYLKELLVSIRKVNMGIMVISHSDRAAALGLDGNFDLMSSFEAVIRLKGNKADGIYAEVETVGGSIVADHPGPYTQGTVYSQPQPSYQPQPVHSEDDRIVELFKAGHKTWKIGEMVYGQKGGYQTNQVEEVLKRNGLV